MDSGHIVARVKNILTTPKAEWPAIAAEPATVGSLYSGYILILAALPALAGFIKGSLIGYGGLGIHLRQSIGSGIVAMLLGYLLGLVVIYLVSLCVNALAPTFGGQKDPVQALKVVAYAWTATWVAGIFVIVPLLGWPIMLAGMVYAIYLLYLGLPDTMKCPTGKAAGYTAVVVILGIVLGWLARLVVVGVMATTGIAGGMAGFRVDGHHATTGQDGDGDQVSVDQDSALGQLAALGKHAGEAGSVEALAPDRIKGFLPETVNGLKRTGLSARRNNAIGMQISQASARYGDGLALEVVDTGSARGFMAMAAAMAPEEEKQTGHGYQRTFSEDGRMIHEEWDEQTHSGEYSVVIARRFTIKASGRAQDIDALKQAVASVDLDQLQSLKDEGVRE